MDIQSARKVIIITVSGAMKQKTMVMVAIIHITGNSTVKTVYTRRGRGSEWAELGSLIWV